MCSNRAWITQGNPDVHVILRGGSTGPNYQAQYVRDCGEKMQKAGFPPKIMVSLLSFSDFGSGVLTREK